MTSQLSAFWVTAGLFGLAGLFFLLQRLKVRQRPVTVETTLFWKDAIEDARARVLVQRFRHPWVYALLLLIGASLWLGFAGLERGGENKGRHVVLIDASAPMSQGTQFEETLEAVEDYVRSIPPQDRWVFVCGGRRTCVLSPNENTELLMKRMEGRAPEACPPSIDAAIEEIASQGGGTATICVAGRAPVSADLAASLRDDVSLVRLGESETEDGDNRGIASFGTSDAQSGEWGKVDVLLSVSGQAGAIPGLELAGRPLAIKPQIAQKERVTHYRYRGVPARGEELVASLTDGGSLTLDDKATLLVPDRKPIAVQVSADIPVALRRALEADPGLSIVDSGAVVAVKSATSSIGEGLPSFVVSTEDAQADGILAIHERSEEPGDVLLALHQNLGLSEIDSSDLSRNGVEQVTMGASPGDARSLQVWESLFTDEFNFTRSRAFPLFVGMGIRWLVNDVVSPSTAAVGATLDLGEATVRNEQGQVFDTLGDRFRPTAAGRYTADSGAGFVASYLAADLKDAKAASELKNAAAAGSHTSLVSLLLVLAMIAILGEWVLYRLGRIP